MRRQVEYFNPQEGKGYFFIDHGVVSFTGFETSELLAGACGTMKLGSQAGYLPTSGRKTASLRRTTGESAEADPQPGRSLGSSHPSYEAHNQQSAFNVTNGTVMLAVRTAFPAASSNRTITPSARARALPMT